MCTQRCKGCPWNQFSKTVGLGCTNCPTPGNSQQGYQVYNSSSCKFERGVASGGLSAEKNCTCPSGTVLKSHESDPAQDKCVPCKELHCSAFSSKKLSKDQENGDNCQKSFPPFGAFYCPGHGALQPRPGFWCLFEDGNITTGTNSSSGGGSSSDLDKLQYHHNKNKNASNTSNNAVSLWSSEGTNCTVSGSSTSKQGVTCNCVRESPSSQVAHVYKCNPPEACLGRLDPEDDNPDATANTAATRTPVLGCNRTGGYDNSFLCSRCLDGFVKDLKSGRCTANPSGRPRWGGLLGYVGGLFLFCLYLYIQCAGVKKEGQSSMAMLTIALNFSQFVSRIRHDSAISDGLRAVFTEQYGAPMATVTSLPPLYQYAFVLLLPFFAILICATIATSDYWCFDWAIKRFKMRRMARNRSMSQTAGRMSMSDTGGRMSMSEGGGMHNRKGSRFESDAFLPTGEDLTIRSADYVSPRAKFVQCSMLILICKSRIYL